MRTPATSVAAQERALPRVLVVEDDEAMARLLARVLRAAGFAVTVALDGRAGLAHAAGGVFELVLLDLGLPDIDGMTVLARMTADAPDQPVLVVSGLADGPTKVRCLELGACDYLTKPFAVAELLARVRLRAHARSGRAAPTPDRRGCFVVDRRRRTVRCGERTVVLTSRELALLEYLMRKDGETCTREELLAHVWGHSVAARSNVVNVYVARLRHKLGGVVTTERNVGYRFVGTEPTDREPLVTRPLA
jgi:two-component system OmpR family response regulator